MGKSTEQLKKEIESTDSKEVLNKVQVKQERFKKLAVPRTRKIIKALKNLSNCSNKNNYSYTNDQVLSIKQAIQDAVKSCFDKFDDVKTNENEFNL